FNIDKKKRFKFTLEVFREILQIYPRVHGRDFDPLPPEEDIVSFLRDLGHTGGTNHLGYVDLGEPLLLLLTESYQKNIDYVELLWEDFTYQIDNKDFKKQEKMYYP
ncbi:hypothetical protein Tco_0142494, partial [Tanacetum coccineum]